MNKIATPSTAWTRHLKHLAQGGNSLTAIQARTVLTLRAPSASIAERKARQLHKRKLIKADGLARQLECIAAMRTAQERDVLFSGVQDTGGAWESVGNGRRKIAHH